MDFVFHSVFEEADHTQYFNVYKIDDTHFLAQCHHFNRERDCHGDFEMTKENGEWKPNDPKFTNVAKQIAEEIDRMEPNPRSENEEPRSINGQ